MAQSRSRFLTIIIGLVLIFVSIFQIWAANRGIHIVHAKPDGLPVTILYPAEADLASRPLVLVGHGFAGSDILMRGFALTFVRAGYVVAAWDFDGHGSNDRTWDSDNLIQNPHTAFSEVRAHHLADTSRVAILGHSMGSGVAMTFGQEFPDVSATIAVSPVSHNVTPQLPHNLLLMAGSLEVGFIRNAEQRLIEAGGEGGDPAAGTARQLEIIQGVEHVSILFSPTAHQIARRWLDATFGEQPGARDYVDRRILWYGLGVIGFLILGISLQNWLALHNVAVDQSERYPLPPPIRTGRWLVACTGGVVLATLILWLLSGIGLGLRDLFGLLVGGYLMAWFGLAGVLSLLLAGYRPRWPHRAALLYGGLVFAILWIGVGLLGSYVWLPWLLIWKRLVLWFAGSLFLLPWFLAVGAALDGMTYIRQAASWVVHNLILIGGLLFALQLNSELSFIMIIMPLFPLMLGLHAVTICPQRGGWAFSLSGAMFTSWIILTVFPLQ